MPSLHSIRIRFAAYGRHDDSDLQEVTVLPQCTVSRHLPVLRHAVLVRDAPNDVTGRLPHALLDALAVTEPLAGERDHELQDPEGGPA